MWRLIRQASNRVLDELRALSQALRNGVRVALLGIAVVVVLAVGGLLSVSSGLVPVAASSGHWRLTYHLLDYAKVRAVKTQSAGIEMPPLDDPAQVLKGAGHYATGCAPCHGAPGKPAVLIAKQMTPKPPYLPEHVDRWSAEELFWIVKHGIKYTGMPAWAALERDDEVRSMVSFLLALPDLTADQYTQLAYGEMARAIITDDIGFSVSPPLDDPRALTEPLSVLDDCARCHGRRGEGREGVFPRLANQREMYLLESLRAFAGGRRFSGIMQPVVADLDDDMLRALAAHYARQPPVANETAERSEAIARGGIIAARGVPARGVPACRHCHGPGVTARNPLYPELAGQYADYLQLQLELFKSRTRGGTEYAHIMETVTRRMTREDMQAVALYYASLPGEPD